MDSEVELLRQEFWAMQEAKEEAVQGRDEARQAREKADQRSRKTTLLEFLDAIHVNYHLTLTVQTDKRKAVQRVRSNATRKYCPTNIKAWDRFPDEQNAIWQQLENLGESVRSSRVFDSIKKIERRGGSNLVIKIASERNLEFYEEFMLQDPMKDILRYFLKAPAFNEIMNLNCCVTFENHTNTMLKGDSEVVARIKRMQITPTKGPSFEYTDQICVYQTQEGEALPCFIVEYKAPHKLTVAHIRAGLHSMNPWDEIVNNQKMPPAKDVEENAVYHSSKLIAAVVTQTFSYMIEGGLEYAYICTGEAFIFLHVSPEDPTTVYYHSVIPIDDVGESTGWEADSEGPNRLHLTAVAQVLAFTLQTLSSRQQSPDWITKAKSRLKHWNVDPNKVLKEIPETARECLESPAFKGRKEKCLEHQSPFFLRSRISCTPDKIVKSDRSDDNKDPGEQDRKDHHTVDAPTRDSKIQNKSSKIPETSFRNQRAIKRTITESYDRWYERKDQCRAMAYCTQSCLRGLLAGGLLDENCPNVETHRKRDDYHCIDPGTFRELIREQLSESLDTDCHALDLQSSRGALFKVRLTSHGYTVAAKCTIRAYISDLLHEAKVYKQLEEIQGIHIPVCLGNIDLPDVLAYQWVEFVHMMFLSWGGQCIVLHAELLKEPHVMDQALEVMQAIHQRGVLHCDAMPRNILWSEEAKHVIFIDFERSEIIKALSKQPLMSTSSNQQSKGEGGDWIYRENKLSLHKKMKANEAQDIFSDTLRNQILDEGDIESSVEPIASDAPKLQVLAQYTETQLTDFAKEMKNMQYQLAMLADR